MPIHTIRPRKTSCLQVADLVAYPITWHVLNPDGMNLAYDVLKKNIYQVDSKMYGMKVFPKE